MPNIPLDRGHTGNFGVGIVHGSLTLNGVGAGYSVSIGAMPAINGVAAAGNPVVFAINNQRVSVSNTTMPFGPVNLWIIY